MQRVALLPQLEEALNSARFALDTKRAALKPELDKLEPQVAASEEKKESLQRGRDECQALCDTLSARLDLVGRGLVLSTNQESKDDDPVLLKSRLTLARSRLSAYDLRLKSVSDELRKNTRMRDFHRDRLLEVQTAFDTAESALLAEQLLVEHLDTKISLMEIKARCGHWVH
jgi:chromosome segregation ATPase